MRFGERVRADVAAATRRRTVCVTVPEGDSDPELLSDTQSDADGVSDGKVEGVTVVEPHTDALPEPPADGELETHVVALAEPVTDGKPDEDA